MYASTIPKQLLLTLFRGEFTDEPERAYPLTPAYEQRRNAAFPG